MAAQLQKVTENLRQQSLGRALAHFLKSVNLASVKNIKYTFNPFHENAESIREMMFQLSVPKRRAANPTCVLKADVRSDRCDPEMTVLFSNGHKAVFRTKNLNAVEIVNEFNKLCKIHDVKQPTKK